MTRDEELWGCALAVLAQHGKGAFLVASMQIDRLDRDDQPDAAAVWREVLRRIEMLEAAQRVQH